MTKSSNALSFFLLVLVAGFANGQQGSRNIPSVVDLIAGADTNKDGKISKAEATAEGRPGRQFAEWDADKDGFATSDEIIAMRKRYGIDAQGRRNSNRPRPDVKPVKELAIPSIDEITRTGKGARPTREEMQWSLSIVGTEPHLVGEKGYFILTDHKEKAWINSLEKLADHRNATVLVVPDLATLPSEKDETARVLAALKREKPRFVAIVPRIETYREKMLMGMWKLLSSIDDDPQLDVFPGLLVAPNASSFAKLIANCINHEPQSADAFKPYVQCHFTDASAGGVKSLQKVGILRKQFAELGYEAPGLIVADRKVGESKPLEADDIVYAVPERRLLNDIPAVAREALEKSSLLVMFGHGSPGMSCGISVDAFSRINLNNKVVMAGSCWSAVPVKLDFPLPGRDAAGTNIDDTGERLLLSSVENGAVVSFGHMRLNQGFPTLYPVLEAWMEGKTVGEAYQKLMNALFLQEKPDIFDEVLDLDPTERDSGGAGGRSPAIPGNRLLYVIIGDPALQPFEKMEPRD